MKWKLNTWKGKCRGVGVALAVIAVFAAGSSFGETAKKGLDKSPTEAAKDEKPSAQEPIVTHHAMKIHGQRLKYTATAGCLTIQDDAGKPSANIFFVAYAKEGGAADSRRPIAFAFNGGPGSSAIWLHLGAMGPRRAVLGDVGAPPKSLELIDNDYTWLEYADLVFIDPVGCGFSRAVEGVDAKRFYNPDSDVESTGSFIRLYVTKYDRWTSPKILVGESYGATRVAGLLHYLQTENGLSINGVVLISSALNFQTILYDDGNDLPYMLALPSLTATALYHKKLPDFAGARLETTLAEVEQWSMTEYAAALAQGDALFGARRAAIVDTLVKYTGLSRDFVVNHRLRIGTHAFLTELMRNEHRTLGLMDGRVAGVAVSPGSDHAYVDPSLFAATGPFVATLNAYVKHDLNYTSSVPYEYLNMDVNAAWKWTSAGQGYLNVSGPLREALALNSRLRVLVAAGLYDLTCPYLGQEYTMNHLGIDPAVCERVKFTRYPSGHQIYTALESLQELTADAAAFIKDACPIDEQTSPAK